MKKINFYLMLMILTSLVSTSTAKAQLVEIENRFWLMAANEAAEEGSEGSEGFTNDLSLNELFRQYNVSRYEKALPFARTENLQKVYELECECNIDSLIDQINTNFPELYSGTRKLDYLQIALYDPADQMWSLTLQNPDNWLWHLKKSRLTLPGILHWEIQM